MKRFSFLTNTLRICAITFLAVLSLSTQAGPGHDHGDEAPTATGVASPRVSTHSDLFELVGIVDHNKMTIYLDRFSTNEPITQAQIELEIAQDKSPIKLIAKAEADGTFSVTNDLLEKPGTYALSFTVTAGKDTDLLAGELKIGATVSEAEQAHDHAHTTSWLAYAGYAAAAIGAVFVALLAWRWQRRRKLVTLSAIATGAIVIAMMQVPQRAIAGPGHDHGDAAPAANSNAPKRLPDGSVFLPKPSQRQLLVRTVPVKQESAPQTVELLGRVVADPNAGGKVQPTQAGRIEVGARGLPTLGQAVRKGEVLAIVRPTVSAIERANQGAQSAELRSNLELARKRLARLEQLEGTVPQKEIEAARAEVQSLSERTALVAPSVSTVESLVAPVSGVIAASNVVAGQVVDAREILFEIIDPARLMVEATAFDVSILSNIASANLALPQNQSAALRFSGAGRTLREGAIPLQFRTTGVTALPLAVGQPVKVIVQTKSQTQGFVVPNAAVVKNPSNQDIVWVHTGEEQFAARTVRWQALDGGRVTVVDGLKADERVVMQGAALLNQVR
ncbi:HlyD family efflux transporter periplasmic adaptor subunit [Variovorax sp. PCZ-1]|uniref:efflux RND transporter periplasmic adaptor subunit n=1 Tax=Variovorax sp. PCZ-1 TaxID=2835533 RepID=UPI0020C17B15|nr:HlyD family efflux transporter periplasmic adaptor subunit [Variovorax sp. PCZ-1]